VAKRFRTTAALETDIVEFAAGLDEASAEWLSLKSRLREDGVVTRDWVAAVRLRRRNSELPTANSEQVDADPIERVDVIISTDEYSNNDAAAAALARLPYLYERSFFLVDVLRDQLSGAPAIREIGAPLVREALTRACAFTKWITRSGGTTDLLPAHPPDWCVNAITARGVWPGVRPLRAIVQTPALLIDGSVLDTPGYDAASGLLYEPNLKPLRVPDQPTAEDLREALDEIFYAVKDIPFADAADGWHVDETADETHARLSRSEHAAAFVSSLLTPFARHAFKGPAPLFVFSANVRGAGKGLLRNIVEWTALGREMQFMVQPTERDAAAEDRKRITSLAISGEPMVVIDNIRAPLGNGALEAALTSTTWGERVLGESKVPRSTLLLTWYATGNNILLAGDMPRRCVMIQLDSPYARPEDRSDFSEANLVGYVQRERARLVWACLVLLRAWTAQGMNDIRDPGPCGSFEGWSKIVRGAVINAGLRDPWTRRGSADDGDADDDAPIHEKFVDGWEEALKELGKSEATADEVIQAVRANDEECALHQRHPIRMLNGRKAEAPRVKFGRLRSALAELVPGLRPGELPNAMQLGRRLTIYKNRPTKDGRRIAFRKSGDRFWSIGCRVAPASSASPPAPRATAPKTRASGG
jgi:hypothetical protein